MRFRGNEFDPLIVIWTSVGAANQSKDFSNCQSLSPALVVPSELRE